MLNKTKIKELVTCPICKKVVTHLMDNEYYCSVCEKVVYDGHTHPFAEGLTAYGSSNGE